MQRPIRRMLHHEFDETISAKQTSPTKKSQLIAKAYESDSESSVDESPQHHQDFLPVRTPNLDKASEGRSTAMLHSPAKSSQLRISSPTIRSREEAQGPPRQEEGIFMGSSANGGGVVTFEKLGRCLDRRLSAAQERIAGASSRRLSNTTGSSASLQLQLMADVSSSRALDVQVKPSQCHPHGHQAMKSEPEQPVQEIKTRTCTSYRVCLVRQSDSNCVTRSRSVTKCPPHIVAALSLVGAALAAWLLLLLLSGSSGAAWGESTLNFAQALLT